MSRDAKFKQACTSARVSFGYSSSTSSTESPAARNSRTVCTVMRVPRTTGLPLQTSGLIEMRSDISLHYHNRLRIQVGKRWYWRSPITLKQPLGGGLAAAV